MYSYIQFDFYPNSFVLGKRESYGEEGRARHVGMEQKDDGLSLRVDCDDANAFSLFEYALLQGTIAIGEDAAGVEDSDAFSWRDLVYWHGACLSTRKWGTWPAYPDHSRRRRTRTGRGCTLCRSSDRPANRSDTQGDTFLSTAKNPTYAIQLDSGR